MFYITFHCISIHCVFVVFSGTSRERPSEQSLRCSECVCQDHECTSWWSHVQRHNGEGTLL